MFSSKSFIVSDLTFRSLTFFEIIFVYGVGLCSNFILLHCPVFPTSLIEETIFSPLYILASFVKHKVPKDEFLSLGFLPSSTGLYFSFCVSTILS